MTDYTDIDPETADLPTFIAMVFADLRSKMIDDGDAEEAILARITRDVDVTRLLDTVAVDISRGRNGNMSDRETAAMLFKIPELAWGIEALREKNARERAMRSG